MRNFILFGLLLAFLASCNKLNDKNIRGNWQIEKFIWNGGDSTSQHLSYLIFNDGGGGFYMEDYGTSYGSQNINWNLDKGAQKLTIGNLFFDQNGTSLSLEFDVDKSGKTMDLTFEEPGNSLKFELRQVVLDY